MYDAIVVGAGPGGSTAAAFMARSGLSVLLLDKASFPRAKVCGDAISGRSVEVLQKLDLLHRFDVSEALVSWGMTMSSPAGDTVHIPFTKDRSRPLPPGFVHSRKAFDTLLVDHAVSAGATLMQGVTVTGLLRKNDAVQGVTIRTQGKDQSFEAPLVVGADGAYSVVVKELGLHQLDEDHYSAGVRAYYKGVEGFGEDNFIELHFIEEALPSYFWIFPMANGMANVGVGMLSSAIKKKSVNLNHLLPLLTSHPRFKDRFQHAELQGATKGWGLPLGSKPRPMAGNGWMLVGDAASLIDPFTGEGIGNAMLSGMLAAEWAQKANASADFSNEFLKAYEKDVLGHLKKELRLSHALQKMVTQKWILNTIIRKAGRSPELAEVLSGMFDDLDVRKKLVSPLFFLRLLFA